MTSLRVGLATEETTGCTGRAVVMGTGVEVGMGRVGWVS